MMSNKHDILFINRDEAFLKKISKSLNEEGYTVHTATDMRGALSAMTSNPVGLIVSENTLRDISGYDFLRFLKNDPLRDNVPFIFLVHLNDQGRAFKAYKLGATDYIVYPIDTDIILSRIKEVFDSHKDAENIPAFDKPEHKPIKIGKKDGDTQERRKNKRPSLIPPIRAEASRNGILWMPAKVKNINSLGLLIETALLGKVGVELYVRITLPTGISVVKGQIRHIAFANHNQSAAMGVEVIKSTQWIDILTYISSVIQKDKESPPVITKTPQSEDSSESINKDILFTGEKAAIHENAYPPTAPSRAKETSYDLRFYQSLIGKQLDNYRAVSFMAAGAMGGVFKGWDIALERTVALKVISYKLSSKESYRDLFIKEARFVSQLDHQNIARIYSIGNVNQILYFAMEYINGETLAEMIKRGVILNMLKGVNYLISLCEALDFVSQKNIIHRDIKPANIMISEDGTIKIVDFGVAKVVDIDGKDNKKDGIVGSPLYISPDSILGNTLDQRSDIYSLGASFYHAFTGFPPFEGKSKEEVLEKHLRRELTTLRKKNPKVSSALGKVIEKMMGKRPEDRYQDYKAIIKDLDLLRTRALKFQKIKNATSIFKVRISKQDV